ncbi:MAG TPA: hypothetical protein VM940_01980 [Chthoniobacterales bacterium]|jgi:hypothetical protein|nr:hypothetical protein [Chthoniobacterales bacterium]
MKNDELHRLLRSAAKAPEEPVGEPPFGFETRVVASWRSGAAEPGDDIAEITRFLRRTGAIGLAVVVLAGAAAYRQFSDGALLAGPQTNEYAIVDSTIQTEIGE